MSETSVYGSFSEAFPEMSTTKESSAKRGADAKRDRAFRDAYRRANRQGWVNVTFVNLHPFQLDLNMGYLGHITVPGKKQGTMYGLTVISQPRFDAQDNGDANFTPIFVTPKEMADDLIREYKDQGGMFYYEGEGVPPENLLDDALESQLQWYWLQFNEGNANWAQYGKNPRHITDNMRTAAKELFRMKLVNHQVEWITVSRNESPDQPCEGCGGVIPKIAKFCPNCNTIYDAEWVKVRRPDIYRAQFPVGEATLSNAVSTDKKGANEGLVSAVAPDIEQLIKEEEDGTSPLATTATAKKANSGQFKKKGE